MCKINWGDYKLWIRMYVWMNERMCVCVFDTMIYIYHHSMAGYEPFMWINLKWEKENDWDKSVYKRNEEKRTENHMHTSSQCIDILTAYMFTLLIMLINKKYCLNDLLSNVFEWRRQRPQRYGATTTSVKTLEYMVK